MFALGASTPLMMVEAEESIILEQSLILVVTNPFKLIALCTLLSSNDDNGECKFP